MFSMFLFSASYSSSRKSITVSVVNVRMTYIPNNSNHEHMQLWHSYLFIDKGMFCQIHNFKSRKKNYVIPQTTREIVLQHRQCPETTSFLIHQAFELLPIPTITSFLVCVYHINKCPPSYLT